MKHKFALLMTFVCCLIVHAQNTQTFPQKQYYASDYGTWSVLGQYPNTYLFSPPGVCLIPTPSVGSFNAFNANAPVWIRDAVAANSEVVTPTSVVATESFCGINAATARSHTSFSLQSATGGLQEVLNQIAPAIPYAAEVILDRNWYSMVNSVPGQTTSAVIASVKGSNAAILEDITQAPQLFYRWNGTQYVAVPNNGSVTSAGLTMPSIFSVAGSPIVASGTFGVTLNSEAANTSLRGPASGSGVPTFRTDTAADVAQAGALYNSIASANINGMMYPAQCGSANPPSWCSGSTADAWYRAACTQLPSTGGFISLLGLTGTIAASATCSTPTKQVITLADNTSALTITETDGGIPFPQDNNSMFIGQGAGQCNFSGGIHLSAGASVTSIVGPAHTDRTQEDFTADGLCLWGATGATVSRGLIYSKATFTNTNISNNNAAICNTSCLWLENVGGIVEVGGNEFNVTDGDTAISGSAIDIVSSTTGCGASSINIHGGNAEHANGGASFPEINIHGDGAGAVTCSLYIHDLYTERGTTGTPSTTGIRIQDCWGCGFTNIQGGGGLSISSGDLINLSQSGANRVQNVMFQNINNILSSATWANIINDSTLTGTIIPASTSNIFNNFVATYYSNPGYVQPPVLPGTTLEAVSADVLGGLGNFSTGSGTLPTGFVQSGCNSGSGLTCTYTRTNSTAPPGSTFSQQIQITANTDPFAGDSGLIYNTPYSFTAGTTYVASFWAKGDGTITGPPVFLLWTPTLGNIYCQNVSPTPLTTTWQVFAFTCTPTVSGSSSLSPNVVTLAGQTGTFWIGNFIFAVAGTPFTPGTLLSSISPFGVGPASSAQQTITLGTTALLLGSTYTTVAGLASVSAGAVSATTGSFTAFVAGSATVSGIATVGQLAMSGGRKGTFVCTAGGTITIANTNELATSDMVISMNAAGGTITTPPAMKTVTAGTGFTVLCGASDTSTYNYDILN